MKENLTEIISVHDTSAQVKEYFEEASNSYKLFVKSQSKFPGETRLTTAYFGNDYYLGNNNKSIKDVVFAKENVEIGGVSSMIDSVVKTMDDVGVRYANTPEEERPSSVIFIIVALGRDNASKNFTYNNLFEKIAHQRDIYKWKFFLVTDFSINMEKLGIPEEDTVLLKKSQKDFFKTSVSELMDLVEKHRENKK